MGPVVNVALALKQEKRPVIDKLEVMKKCSTHKVAVLPMLRRDLSLIKLHWQRVRKYHPLTNGKGFFRTKLKSRSAI
jgi:hypothetical protein